MRETWDDIWVKTEIDSNLLADFKRANIALYERIWKEIKHKYGRLFKLRVAELGSGLGKFSLLMALEGANVTLYDFSEVALTKARELYQLYDVPAEFINENLFHLKEKNEFDIVMSHGTCEHFNENERFQIIQLHKQLVKEDGLIVINVPNKFCISYVMEKKFRELIGRWPWGFEKAFSRSELKRVASELNLKDVRIYGFYILGFRTHKRDIVFLRNYLGYNLLLLGYKRRID